MSENVQILIAVGEHIYGPNWKTQFSADLGITSRQIGRYVNEGVGLGDYFRDGRQTHETLLAILEEHHKDTIKLIAMLKVSIDKSMQQAA